MKNIPFYMTIKPAVSRLRIPAVGVLLLGAAALAAVAINPNPPKLPWAVPTISLPNIAEGFGADGAAVDPSTNTIYVASVGFTETGISGNIAVVDGSRCDATNASRCTPVATITDAGPAPVWMVFDPSSSTLYVTSGLTATGDDNNQIRVFNTRTCNARNTSGCGQTPAATLSMPGRLSNNTLPGPTIFGAIVLDSSAHTLYVGDAYDGPVSIINTATCNGTTTTDCTTPLTMANGNSIAIDPTNHSVYVTGAVTGATSVFSDVTCNADTQSDCTAQSPVASLPDGFLPFGPGAVDPTTHTVYVPITAYSGVSDVALVDGSTCNATIHSGCGNAPHLAPVGSVPEAVILDASTNTVYVMNLWSASISVLNAATCNSQTQAGCPQVPPALAMEFDSGPKMIINPDTHTLYAPSQWTNDVWVFDTTKCNATRTNGCTKFAPTTTVGANPVGVAANPNTHTVYEANQADNTGFVIDASVCNASNTSGCDQTWPTVPLGNEPRFIGINKTTNTIYAGNFGDGTLSVINGATCNSSNSLGCSQPQPTTSVGNHPQQIAVDEANNTIYVANQDDGTVSVIDGAHCNGTDTSGCNQSWPTVTVGNSPQALGLNPTNHTLYVTNTNDDTVSVISTSHCNGGDSSGCTPVATVPVGAAPRAVGIVIATNTVFVGNRADVTVSVIDGSTCNGTNTSGCGQTPFAVPVAAFPNAAGNGDYIFGRAIAIDPATDNVFMPLVGDSDVVVINGRACRGGNTAGCQAKVVPLRMGGFPVVLTVDESSGTVYVSNNDDGTVSLFSARAPLAGRSMERGR